MTNPYRPLNRALARIVPGVLLGLISGSFYWSFSRWIDDLGWSQSDFTQRLWFPGGWNAEAADGIGGGAVMAIVLLFIAPLLGLIGGTIVGVVASIVARRAEGLEGRRPRVIPLSTVLILTAILSGLVSPIIGSWLNIVYFVAIAGATELIVEKLLSPRRRPVPAPESRMDVTH